MEPVVRRSHFNRWLPVGNPLFYGTINKKKGPIPTAG
jgi:hypothetical protein